MNTLYTLRFADWDSDGDMDILVADSEYVSPYLFGRDPEKRWLWLYERRPGDVFEKKRLMDLVFTRGGDQNKYKVEVADWDGDLDLFHYHSFLSLCFRAVLFFPVRNLNRVERLNYFKRCFIQFLPFLHWQVIRNRICWCTHLIREL